MALKIISEVLMSVDKCVELANSAELAYHIGTGNDPETFVPMTLFEPQRVAMNMAGVYAVQTASSVIAEIRDGKVTERGFEQALRDIATGNLSDLERSVARRCSNLSWKAGQPFRGLERIKRSAMVDFNLLPTDEIAKDDDQLRAAAKELIRYVGRPAID